MFKGNRGRERSAMPAVAQPSGGKRGMFSLLGPDVIVTGNVSAAADLHIDGRVEGDVNCCNLVQGADSKISGGVIAETARLAGTVEGSVRVRQLTVERTAKISGDVEYETITVENGGHIDGRLKHMGAVQKTAAAAARPLDAASLLAASPQSTPELRAV